MKKSILVVLALICVKTTFSQINPGNQPEYLSVFGDTSTLWNLFFEIPDHMVTDSAFVSGDTIINEKAYKKVIRQNPITVREIYFLRETADYSKVFYYSAEVDTDYLVLDLNLELSDTFYIGNNLSHPAIVDSVYYLENRKYIRFDTIFDLSGIPVKFEFIEGVGTNFGLLYPESNMALAYRNYLLCAYHNGNQVYANKDFNGYCHLEWSPIKEYDYSELQMFPNPADRQLTIDSEGFQGMVNYSMFSADGRIISWKTSRMPVVINTSTLADGLYIMVIRNDNAVTKGKFLVKH